MRSRVGIFLTLFAVLTLYGCGDDKGIVSSNDTLSPDGNWIATVDVVQYGGPGTAGLQTEVKLGPSRRREERTLILLAESNQLSSSSNQHIYVLWQGSRHIYIKYPSADTIDFKADQAYNVTITADAGDGG